LAQVVLQDRALADLERLTDFLVEKDTRQAAATIALVNDALAVLERHPLIGRPVEEGLRELVISRGRSGYVALYRYVEPEDLVLVLAVRHQRELGHEANEG
jgi:addiction module RelE/StbE family toxin